MVRTVIAVVGLLALAGEARADETAFQGPPEIPRARPMREQLAEAFDEFGQAIDEHLGILTNDVLDLQFDGRRKRGRMRLRGEVARMSIGFDSRIKWERGGAHVNASIELRLGDSDLRIVVPEFEVRPTSVQGERGVEIRIPLISGTF